MANQTEGFQWDRLLGMMNRRDFLVTSIATGVMAMMPRFVSAQAKPYRIGVLMPSTGAGASYSERVIKGLPLVAAEINKRGGLLGKHPIELYFRDTQTKPDVGAREARSLIMNDKVQAIYGTWSSAVALAVQEIIHENKILHLTATSNSSKIVHENYTPWTFLFGPDSRMQTDASVVGIGTLIKMRGWKTYVTLALDYEWGRDAQKIYVDSIRKLSPETRLVKELWVKLGETDMTSYITAIMGLKPDFMIAATAGKDTETFIQQGKASGLFQKVACPGIFLPVTELMDQRRTLPRNLIGYNRVPFFALMDNPMMQKYVKLYQAKFGKDDYPDDFACMGFDAFYALEQATAKAKSIENEAVRKALTGATLDTCRGRLEMRACNNQLDAPSYVGEVVDSPQYPFPIFDPKSLIRVEGHEVWLPTCEEVEKVKKKRT